MNIVEQSLDELFEFMSTLKMSKSEQERFKVLLSVLGKAIFVSGLRDAMECLLQSIAEKSRTVGNWQASRFLTDEIQAYDKATRHLEKDLQEKIAFHASFCNLLSKPVHLEEAE